MGWSAIIIMLIELFGPLLIEWLKKWLEDRLNKAAASLPAAESYGSPELARAALFDEAIAALPRLAFARRALLRRMKATDANPTPEALAELRDIAGAAEQE